MITSYMVLDLQNYQPVLLGFMQASVLWRVPLLYQKQRN
jgi:hypothetical protein